MTCSIPDAACPSSADMQSATSTKANRMASARPSGHHEKGKSADSRLTRQSQARAVSGSKQFAVRTFISSSRNPRSSDRTSLLIGECNLHYVENSGVGIHVDHNGHMLTLVSFQGIGVIHFVAFVILVIREVLTVGTYATRHVLISLRVGLVLVGLVLLTSALLRRRL